MKFIVAKKLNMTQVFDEEGKAYSATILSATPVVVTQVKNKDKDGYKAIQIGYGTKKESRTNKAQIGHTKTLGIFEGLKEFRVLGEDSTLNKGDKVDVGIFAKGDVVEISGISKGKGFQGVVKRHGFKGGPRTHGQKHSEREPGSIGGGGRAGGRVAKGMRMAGRMGGDRTTVKNLNVLHVDAKENLILLEGSVPGKRGDVIEIRSKRQ